MRTASIGGLGLVLVLSGCSGSSDGGTSSNGPDESSPSIARADVVQTPASAVPAGSISVAVTANDAFATDLYAHVLAAPSATGNVLTSPLSASFALTMTYAGAAGSTATEMAHALHFDPTTGNAIFEGQNAISQALAGRGAAALAQAQQNAKSGDQAAPSADDYDLTVLNSVWGQESYTWASPFLTTLAQDYGTGVYQRDFVAAYEPARLAINAWVSDATKNKINDLLPMGSINPTTRMVLVNALHLKFPWDSPFDVSATQAGAFTRADGSSVSASFMNQTHGYAYADDGRAQIAALPLTNRELSVVIALPHVGVDLASYEATLGTNAAALAIPSSSSLVQLSLPKVNFTTQSVSLASALQDMGMVSAFKAGAANFSGLTANPSDAADLYVSDVLQKAMVSMQETGVEAAAATAVILAGLSIADPDPPPQPVSMVVNRPYLLAVVDNPTGAILMLGHIVDPTDAGSP